MSDSDSDSSSDEDYIPEGESCVTYFNISVVESRVYSSTLVYGFPAKNADMY